MQFSLFFIGRIAIFLFFLQKMVLIFSFFAKNENTKNMDLHICRYVEISKANDLDDLSYFKNHGTRDGYYKI